MEQLVRRTLAGCALAITAGGHATPLAAQMPSNWSEPTAPFRVIGNVYYVGSAGISAWLITSPRGHILLDAGVPDFSERVEANIRTLGFRLRDVKILLHSHAHMDHVGGMARIRRATGARLFSSAGDRDALERGVYIGSEEVAILRFPAVRVDSVIPDGARITLGGDTLTAHHTPGHTAGGTTWTMPVTIDGVRHTVIFLCSLSVAANRLVPQPQYPGIVEDYRRTFARLKGMQGDVVLAAHAEQFDLPAKRARLLPGAPNPFIVPGDLVRIVSTAETEFAARLAAQARP